MEKHVKLMRIELSKMLSLQIEKLNFNKVPKKYKFLLQGMQISSVTISNYMSQNS